ncbi:MAG: hypothetical protein PHP50_08520 [Lachnospiraceae bacterium]|nr:hypothetical protein [Lachnospiraceae bacterium]
MEQKNKGIQRGLSLQQIVDSREHCVFRTKEDWEQFVKRHHFNIEEIPHISGLWEALRGLLQPRAWYMQNENTEVLVTVTLGDGLDELQELYLEREEVGDAYILECLGMSILQRAYEELQPFLHDALNLWMGPFCFIDQPDRIKEILEQLGDCTISLTDAGMLLPKKSVVFTAPLEKERKDSSCHICDQCTLFSCPNRV